MWPFGRRSRRGKHLLGAAVTGIPAWVPAPPALVARVEVGFTPPALPPDLPLVSVPVQVAGPRVELGFRDGSTAALAPDSDQARALTDLASLLNRRD